MAWPGTISNQITGTLITATLWNELVDGINFEGNTHDHNGDPGDGVTLVQHVAPTVSIINSTAETNLWSTTIPANALQTTGVLITYAGFFHEHGVSSGNVTFRLKYGATTIATIVSASLNTNDLPGILTMAFVANGATNSQLGVLRSNIQDTQYTAMKVDEGSAAEDSTTALALTLTAQLNQAEAGSNLTYHASVILGPFL